MMAPSVRSCFSKNTVPAMKKNPMMVVSPNKMYESATRRRVGDIGSNTASQMSPEKMAACKNRCRT
jgi:hypothetical protein